MLRICALACAIVAFVQSAIAQNQSVQPPWPTKDVRVIVPFPPAAAGDIIIRTLADGLKAAWGKSIIIENIPGAAGSVGVGRLAKSQPDGYTIGISGDAALVVNVSLYKQIPYDPIKDIAPILQIGITPNILVINNDIPAKTLPEFIALAQSKSGKIKFNSAGYGTSQHMGIEQLKKAAGIQVIHVPSKEIPAAEVMGGHVDANFSNITTALPLIQGGKLRALGQSGTERSSVAADIPTIAEQGYAGFNAVAWFGMIAPAGTPDAIVRKIHADVSHLLTDPAIRKSLTDRGIQIVASTPEKFATLIKSEIPRIADLLKDSGIKLD